MIIHSKGDGSEGRDLVRHLRNGIAHGKTKVFSRDGHLWFELKDYNTKKEPTAYTALPIGYLSQLQSIYISVCRQKKTKAEVVDRTPGGCRWEGFFCPNMFTKEDATGTVLFVPEPIILYAL